MRIDPRGGKDEPPPIPVELDAREGIDGGSDGVLALPSRLEAFAIAHRCALAVSAYLDEQTEGSRNERLVRAHRSAKLEACGRWLLFRNYYRVDVVRLHAASFCKDHLLCDLCAMLRARKYTARIMQRIETLDWGEQGWDPWLITFTVKNGDDMEERFAHLRSSLLTVWKRRTETRKRGRGSSAFAAMEGAIGGIELKRGKQSGQGHPHAHLVSFWSDTPRFLACGAEWLEITGDSKNVHFDAITDRGKGLVGSVMEAVKYPLKPGDISIEDRVAWASFLRSRRLLLSVGVLHGVKVPTELSDDMTELLADEPFLEYVYRWLERASHYNFDGIA